MRFVGEDENTHRVSAVFDLEELIAGLPERPDVDLLVAGFVPPARFADKRFENYHPADPSQSAARERLETLAKELQTLDGSILSRLRLRLTRPASGSGVYLDGGFGVGKTHLLAAFWNAAPSPKSYLTFGELVYFIGLVGVNRGAEAFAHMRVVAIDEWELDDPGNLKLALAFLRGVLRHGSRIAVTSNTLPLELGRGRFSQKDFRDEIEEVAGAFSVIRIEGSDFRHRHFEADPGIEYFLDASALAEAAARTERAVLVSFAELIKALDKVHPIRYADLIDQVGGFFVRKLQPVTQLNDALRWVHFVDSLYDSATPLRASSALPLSSLFPHDFARGPYGKKISRCLSRMEEMLTDREAP